MLDSVQFIDVVYDKLEDLRVTVDLDLNDLVSAVFQLCLKVLHVLQNRSPFHQKGLDNLHLRIDYFNLDEDSVSGFGRWRNGVYNFGCVFFYLAVQFIQLLVDHLVSLILLCSRL